MSTEDRTVKVHDLRYQTLKVANKDKTDRNSSFRLPSSHLREEVANPTPSNSAQANKSRVERKPEFRKSMILSSKMNAMKSNNSSSIEDALPEESVLPATKGKLSRQSSIVNPHLLLHIKQNSRSYINEQEDSDDISMLPLSRIRLGEEAQRNVNTPSLEGSAKQEDESSCDQFEVDDYKNPAEDSGIHANNLDQAEVNQTIPAPTELFKRQITLKNKMCKPIEIGGGISTYFKLERKINQLGKEKHEFILTENGRNLHVDNYRSTKQLGTGCFGSVYKVVDVKTNQVYALKLFNKDLIKEKMSKNSHGFQEEALLNNEIKWLRELVSSVDVEPPQPSKV